MNSDTDTHTRVQYDLGDSNETRSVWQDDGKKNKEPVVELEEETESGKRDRQSR